MQASPLVETYRHLESIPGVSLRTRGELVSLQVENDSASAEVFLQGAQLAHYQRHDEPPVLWCSPLCDYREGNPLRGGIPICWPWFGDLDANPHAIRRQYHSGGAHGFARNRLWQLDNVERVRGDLTRATLSLPPDSDCAAGESPTCAAALQLTIEVGKRLRLGLDVHNPGPEAFYFSAALHSYYAVSDIDAVRVEGLERLSYLDTVGEASHGRQRGPLTIDREVDRIYHGTWSPLKLVDRGWRRVLLISSEGSDSAVLWNPWVDKAKRLSQFADEAYREMLCIETANAGDDFVVLQAGERHRLGFTLRCKPL